VLRAQFNTQVDPADALGAEVGVEDNSVARAEGKHPTVQESGLCASEGTCAHVGELCVITRKFII